MRSLDVIKVSCSIDSFGRQITKAEHEAGTALYQFEPSPIMSSYLVCVVVGEFEGHEGQAVSGGDQIKVRALTPRGKKKQGLFALETSIRVRLE